MEIKCLSHAMHSSWNGDVSRNCHRTRLQSRRLLRARIRTRSINKPLDCPLALLPRSTCSEPYTGAKGLALQTIQSSCTYPQTLDFGMTLGQNSIESTTGLIGYTMSGQNQSNAQSLWSDRLGGC